MSDIERLIADAPSNEREATYLACWTVAFCDGRLWREKRLLEDIAAELLLPKKTARAIEKQARNGKTDFDEPASEAGRRVMFHFLLKTAAADGKLNDNELPYAERFGRHLELDSDEIATEFHALIPDAYRPKVRRTRRRSRPVISPHHAESATSLVEGMRVDAAEAGSLHRFTNYVLPFLLMAGAHLVPVFGALFWEWEIPTILLIYWGETVIVGIINAVKLTLSRTGENPQFGKLGNTLFFCFHYGAFTLVHGAVVVLIIATGWLPDESFAALMDWIGTHLAGILLAVGTIAVEHVFFFYVDFVREEKYRRTTQDDHFARPYSRIVAMHIAVLGGGLGMHQLGWGRAIPVMIMIGLHLLIETIIWANELPPRGFLGGIRKAVNSGAVGVAIAFVPLLLIALFGVWALRFAATLLAWTFPATEAFAKAVGSVEFSFRVGFAVCLLSLFCGLAGLVLGWLDHLQKLDSEKLTHSLLGRYVALSFFGLLLLAGTVSAFVPVDQIMPPRPDAEKKKSSRKLKSPHGRPAAGIDRTLIEPISQKLRSRYAADDTIEPTSSGRLLQSKIREKERNDQ